MASEKERLDERRAARRARAAAVPGIQQPPPSVAPSAPTPTAERVAAAPPAQRPPAERVRSLKAPAAGVGTWPLPEDEFPAAMPSDELADGTVADGSKVFASVPGVKRSTNGSLQVRPLRFNKQAALTIEKAKVAEAAHIFMRIRRLHPGVTLEVLSDLFYAEVESWLGDRIAS